MYFGDFNTEFALSFMIYASMAPIHAVKWDDCIGIIIFELFLLYYRLWNEIVVDHSPFLLNLYNFHSAALWNVAATDITDILIYENFQ